MPAGVIVGTRVSELDAMAVSATVGSMVSATLGAGVAASSVIDVPPVPQKRSTWKEPRLWRPWYPNSLSSPSAQIMWMAVPAAVGMACFDGSAGVVLRVKVKMVSPLSPPLWVELVAERSFSSAGAMPAVD